jgi:hypothetical protein
MIGLLRLGALYGLVLVCVVLGSLPVANALPAGAASEPGLVPPGAGLLIIALVNVLVIAALILTSRWRGRRLALTLALVYYGAVTILPQIETWYFLSALTVDRGVLWRLFVMGLPTAFVFIPLAVRILGRWRPDTRSARTQAVDLAPSSWIWRAAALAIAYVAIYWTAGYFIAWQNPELRAFYGQPGPPLPFVTHTLHALRSDPVLFAFQLLRGLLWVLCAAPVIRGSAAGRWPAALLVALLFSVPQNVGQILANPLMPLASVRASHLIETASSTFVFGLLVAWLLAPARAITSAYQTSTWRYR